MLEKTEVAFCMSVFAFLFTVSFVAFQYSASRVSTSQFVSVHLFTDQYVSVFLSTSQYVSVQFITGQYVSVVLSTSQHVSMQFSGGQNVSKQFNASQYVYFRSARVSVTRTTAFRWPWVFCDHGVSWMMFDVLMPIGIGSMRFFHCLTLHHCLQIPHHCKSLIFKHDDAIIIFYLCFFYFHPIQSL